MKKAALAVLVLAAAIPAFADNPPAAQKAQAKTKATPKAAPKKAVKAEFEAYEAGAWLPVNNRKSHLLGYKITAADLFMQPVLVVLCDPIVAIDGKKREENADGKYIYNLIGWEAKESPHFQVVNVPSVELSSDDMKELAKSAGKSAGIPGCPWYSDFGLEKEPANPKKIFPFYYVVGIDGKVHYAGEKGVKAQRILWEQLRKGGAPHPMLGFYKPTVHTAIAEKLVFGESTAKAVQKLTPIAKAKGESEAKADAAAILAELKQAETYWLKQVLLKQGSNPPMALMLAAQAQKTFPKNKEFKGIVDRIKGDPRVAPTIQTFMKVADIQAKMKAAADKNEELKKSDLKKWYPIVCNAEKKVNGAKKQLGDNLPRAFLCLEDLVQTVKAELEAQGAGGK